MASVGIGYKIVSDLMVEISLHFIEPLVNTSLTAPVTAGNNVTASVGSTSAMYVGAMVLIDRGLSTQEVITVLSVLTGTQFTANFAFSHTTGAGLLGATFPTQQPTDPFFTQTEVLSYLARSQNELLGAVPMSFAFATQTIEYQQPLYPSPATMVEIERISVQGERLYETSQEDWTMQNPYWRNTSTVATPQAWYEDRTGVYTWGVFPVLASNFPAEILYSQRDTDTLALTDGFLVPDPMLHIVKYGAMGFMWSKDGEQKNGQLAAYAQKRFSVGKEICSRWMEIRGLRQGNG